MNRKKAAELLPIIKAFSEGKAIQVKDNNVWKDVDDNHNCVFLPEECEYRIKSEPKYRPFANAEECWNEMQKHQPFGWIKFKNGEDGYIHFYKVRNVGIFFDSTNLTFEEASEYYTFIDNTPFGIKEEE